MKNTAVLWIRFTRYCETDRNNGEAWYLLTRCYLHENQVKALEDTFRLIPNDIDNIAFLECAKGAL